MLAPAAAALAMLVAAAGCSFGDADAGRGPAGEGESGGGIFPDSVVAPLIDAVPERTVTELPEARLVEGLLPPTNRWFSGLVFGGDSMPVFPLPLSFQLTDGGFELGVPNVTTAPKVIMGGFVGHVGADFGADAHRVSAYDTASVTISQFDGDTELGATVIAQGSPFVHFTASEAVDVELRTSFTPDRVEGLWTAEVDGTTYGLVSEGSLSDAGTTLKLDNDQNASWFAVAEGAELADFAEAARHPITGTSLDYAVEADHVTTSIRYETEGDRETLVAALPHQHGALVDGNDCGEGSYPSVYGEMRLCAGNTLSWSAPLLEPSGHLDLSGLDNAQRAELADQVAADVESSLPFAEDTYFGGKSLYRSANLMSVARQVGADDAADELKDRLVRQIGEWMEPGGCEVRDVQCFVYDAEGKGIIGLMPSFGSEEFNDHHFHYGYFLYAAGVVAADDADLAEEWAPVMNLLAADLATSGESSFFPELRVFDAYGSHSWASGTSPFGDGNNQESSSEAVTAWNGLALWATASDQPALLMAATWMLSAEADSARAYWTDFPLDEPIYEGFEHTITSLVWGGKRDYATWFSAEPSAMLGIVVLPISPVSGYLGVDPDRVRANLEDSAPDGFDVLFGDYLLMYSALEGPDAAAEALDIARTLSDERIDDGNSRAYMLAWLMLEAGQKG